MKVNEHVLAIAITLAEGKKVSLSIAQIKEVLRLTRRALQQFEDKELLEGVHRKQRRTV